jgi:hypothetical protein
MNTLPDLSAGFTELSDRFRKVLEELDALRRENAELRGAKRNRAPDTNRRNLRRRVSELRDARLNRASTSRHVHDAESDADPDAEPEPLPEDFAVVWRRLCDLEVTFRGKTRSVAEWCPFSLDLDDPRNVLNCLNPPSDGETGWTLAYSVEQSDKSIFLHLVTTACRMLGIPSVIVVCETKGNTAGVESKMTGLGEAIIAAAAAIPDFPPPDVSAMQAMDGVKKNWDTVGIEDFAAGRKTFVVPGTYLPAVRCLADYVARSGATPMIFIDEGDKLAKYFFKVTDPDSRLPALEKCLKKLYLSARVNCFVTATPSSFLLFGKENCLRFRAFIADVDRIKAAGYETGDHIVLHPSCATLTDKDFDKLSGFFIPQIQAGVRDMYSLSQMADGPTGLLGLFAINHVHNPCDQFSNCDMARIIVHGIPEEITRGKHDIEARPPLCPNAFALVLSGEKAYVACAEEAMRPNEAGPGWEGFKAFGTKNGLDAKTRAAEWIHSWPDAMKRPMFVFGYESTIRSFSPRFGTRVLTSSFVHLKKSKNTDCAEQLAKRGNGDGVPAQLQANGLFATTTYCTKDDFDIHLSYHPYMRETLQYALDGYVPMEHVFEGGEAGKELSKPCRHMKFAKRRHFPAKNATGNPIGNIRVSAEGADKTPEQLAGEELARKNEELVRKAATHMYHAALRARMEAAAAADAAAAAAEAAADAAEDGQEFVDQARETIDIATAITSGFKHLALCHSKSWQLYRFLEHSLTMDALVPASAMAFIKAQVAAEFPAVILDATTKFTRDEARVSAAKDAMAAGHGLTTEHPVEVIVDLQADAQDAKCEIFVAVRVTPVGEAQEHVAELLPSRRRRGPLSQKLQLLVLIHEMVGGRIDVEFTSAQMRDVPAIDSIQNASQRRALRALVNDGCVWHNSTSLHSGIYKLTAAGVAQIMVL